jgi:uncharacterized membrane protein (UPF0136 family)
MNIVGYYVSTFLFAMFAFWWIGARKPVRMILVALGTDVFNFLLFGKLLGLAPQLPTGFLI